MAGALDQIHLGADDLVFMCSGQGSQKPGMGADLMDVPQVRETIACASDVLGRDIASLMAADDAEASARLNETRNAQAAIAALSIGIGRALMAEGIAPSAMLGFSLGQVSALALSGMLADEDAFALIDARSEAMDAAAKAHPGAMSALLKADLDRVEALCDECSEGEVLVAANHNCPGQIVIAGEVGAIERAEAAWSAQGGRASRLATQGAFHSPLMEDACGPFAAYLETVAFAEPSVPVICNTDARPLDAQTVKERLVSHLVSPVLFDESVQGLMSAGAMSFVEVGFGGVLSGLVRRIDKTLERHCVQDAASLRELIDERCA